MTLGLVAIVKDESERIGDFLVKASRWCDVATIVDTGSTDDTRSICELIYPGSTSVVEWDGFGPARSAAFALAHGTADWLLALDADMTVEIDEGWEPDPAVDAYMVAMGNGGSFTWRLPLVLNGQVEFRSIGRAHEYTARCDGQPMVTRPTDAVTVRYPDRSSVGKSEWHLRLLELDYADDRDDPRTVFYMAQTLRDLGQTKDAAMYYRRRAGMGGYADEAYYAAYQAAVLEPDRDLRWAGLLRAWHLRPQRLEARWTLCRELNAADMHEAAYLLSAPPYANPEGLFVDRAAGDWGLDFERSIAASWVGWHDEALALCDDLLANPSIPPAYREQVIRNRVYSTAA
jgi:hypothetical protein